MDAECTNLIIRRSSAGRSIIDTENEGQSNEEFLAKARRKTCTLSSGRDTDTVDGQGRKKDRRLLYMNLLCWTTARRVQCSCEGQQLYVGASVSDACGPASADLMVIRGAYNRCGVRPGAMPLHLGYRGSSSRSASTKSACTRVQSLKFAVTVCMHVLPLARLQSSTRAEGQGKSSRQRS